MSGKEHDDGLDASLSLIHILPFYTYGISLGDEICVTEEDGEYHFQSIVNPSGNSTLRVHFNDKRMPVSYTHLGNGVSYSHFSIRVRRWYVSGLLGHRRRRRNISVCNSV